MVTLLVQMANEKWTTHALHIACSLARAVDAQIALLQLIHVTHPGYLGTAFGNKPLNKAEYHQLEEYAATAEDYGVELNIHWMQCITSSDAIVEAADTLNAAVVFAYVAPSRVQVWRHFQVWDMKRRLTKNNRQLFTLDEPMQALEWTPSIHVKAAPLLQPEPQHPHVTMRDK